MAPFFNFIPKTHYRYFVFVVSLPEIPVNSHVKGYMTRGPVGWSRSVIETDGHACFCVLQFLLNLSKLNNNFYSTLQIPQKLKMFFKVVEKVLYAMKSGD